MAEEVTQIFFLRQHRTILLSPNIVFNCIFLNAFSFTLSMKSSQIYSKF